MKALSIVLFSLICLSYAKDSRLPQKPVRGGENWHLLQFSDETAEWIQRSELLAILDPKISTNVNFTASDVAKNAIRSKKGFRFIDITQEYESGKRSFIKSKGNGIPNYPTPNAAAHKEVTTLFSKVDPNQLKQTVTDMSNLNTRYYLSKDASKSPALLRSKVEALVKSSGQKDVKVDYIENSKFDQPNLRVIIPAKQAKFGNEDSLQIVVIGGHLDSTVYKSSSDPEVRSPGADDDASGSATVLETFRMVLLSKWRGTRPIHFVWFAAEEAGLLGSNTVATRYKSEGLEVYGMLQLDMTGYLPKGPSFTIMNDPNIDFANYLADVAASYLPTVPVQRSTCGYACSDHWSFDRQKYPAGLAIEADLQHMDPYIHSDKDVLSELNFNGMADYVRLALAFATEIAR